MTQRELEQRLPTIVHTIAQSISSSPNIRYEGRFPLPQRGKVIECVNLLQKIAYPGYFEESVAAADGIESHVGALINELTELLYQQVRFSLRFRQQKIDASTNAERDNVDEAAALI